MYDACDDQEIANLGPCLRKLIDGRRNTKPNKPNDQMLVCTPFDPSAFNFTKIKNPREKLLKLKFSTGSTTRSSQVPAFPRPHAACGQRPRAAADAAVPPARDHGAAAGVQRIQRLLQQLVRRP